MKIEKKIARGFTLIELLIVVVVIGVLASIGLPTYNEQVRKGKRAEGKAALLKGAQLQERYYTANNAYADSTNFPTLFGLAASASVYSHDSGTTQNSDSASPYTITVTAGATGTIASSFQLNAVPNGAFTDSKCGTLSITNTGLKSASSGSVSDCW